MAEGVEDPGRDLVREYRPGFRFFRKPLSQLGPRGLSVASLRPQLSSVPGCGAELFFSHGTSPCSCLDLPCGFVLSQGPRGSSTLPRLPKSPQPLLGADIIPSTRKLFVCHPVGSLSVLILPQWPSIHFPQHPLTFTSPSIQYLLMPSIDLRPRVSKGSEAVSDLMELMS